MTAVADRFGPGGREAQGANRLLSRQTVAQKVLLMRSVVLIAPLLLLPCAWLGSAGDHKKEAERPWRSLPLVKDGKVSPDWVQVGWGGFVAGSGLRSECDGRGMGLLLYRKEKFGNCQVRVVYRCKDARANSGVFVRIDDGILGGSRRSPRPFAGARTGNSPRRS
jgi:hypothetical protein